jgi:hypothetical protein
MTTSHCSGKNVIPKPVSTTSVIRNDSGACLHYIDRKPMSKPFHGARLKIERAHKHIADLDTCVSAFFDTSRHKLILEKDPQTGRSNYRVELTGGDIPEVTGLIIGDAIHNLKSALDIGYHDFVRGVGGTIDRHTRFPARETKDALKAAIKGGSIKGSPDAQKLVVETIQPYSGGDNSLWALHELNIADKHQLIIPLAEATEVRGIDAKVGGHTLSGMGFGITGGRIGNIISSNQDIYITNYGKVSGQIVFQGSALLLHQPVIPSLLRVSEEVSRTIETFAAFVANLID